MKGAADVLVVGAGPTGLMLANQLARRGVRARIIDRHTGPSLQTRALEWSTELVGLAQDTSHVKATLKQPDGTIDEVTVAWVAGCDGARSAVRELSGIAFEGAPYEHVFFVADTRVTGPMVPDELNVYLWREGFHLFFPMRGTDHWRLV